jgi:outer membrane protein
MSKKIILLLIVAIGLSTAPVAAQRYCVIDSEYILDNLNEYKRAQTKLDDISKTWQKEIDTKIQEVERLYKSYQAESVMLSDEMKKRREDNIINKEKEAKTLQKQRFGFEGDLFKKRQELVKPVQDKVYNSVQKIAKRKGYDIIFDKSSDLSIFYSIPKIDMSDAILLDLGVTNPKRK